MTGSRLVNDIDVQLNNPRLQAHHLVNLALEFEATQPLIELGPKFPVEAIDGIVLKLVAVIHLHDVH